MGLFDLFGGKDAAEDAAAQNAALYQGYGQQANNIYGNYGNQSTGAVNTGVNQGVSALGTGLSNQIASLTQGLAGATGYGQQAVGAYAPLSALGTQYGTGVTSLLNALGVNGKDAYSGAIDQFRNTPGYQFQQQEAAKTAGNKAASLGIAGSGNTLQAISDRAGNIADTTFNQNFLQPLSQFINPTLQATAGAASGISGAYNNLANTYNTAYGNAANIYGQNAGALAGLYGKQGEDLSNIYGNVAQGQAGAARDVTGGLAQGNTNVANADAQQTSNFWNLLGNLGGSAAKAYSAGKA